VFVDGCFWHGCPQHSRPTRINTSWWEQKRAYNIAKDAETDDHLARLGWLVLRCWEHENPAEVASRVAQCVLDRRRLSGA
jgi:DNA mismatch endonuclease, patch repair protein